MIKTLEISLGQVGVLSLLDPPMVGVPIVAPGVVLASGYYTEQTTGQLYYYDALKEQWYYVTATGYIYPLSISWKPSPSPKIDLVGGDKLRLNLTFMYMGPQVTRTFRAALGDNKTSGIFDEWTEFVAAEKWYAEKDITIPAKATPTLITGQYIDIIIPTSPGVWGDHDGKDAACYCKIMNGWTLTEGINCTPQYYNVCHVIRVKGEFSEFSITKFEKAA